MYFLSILLRVQEEKPCVWKRECVCGAVGGCCCCELQDWDAWTQRQMRRRSNNNLSTDKTSQGRRSLSDCGFEGLAERFGKNYNPVIDLNLPLCVHLPRDVERSNITWPCVERNIVFVLKADTLLLLFLAALWPSAVFQDGFLSSPTPPHTLHLQHEKDWWDISFRLLCGLLSVGPLAVVMARASFQEVVANPISSRETRTRCVFTLQITAPLCLLAANQAPPPILPRSLSLFRESCSSLGSIYCRDQLEVVRQGHQQCGSGADCQHSLIRPSDESRRQSDWCFYRVFLPCGETLLTTP